MKTLLGKHAIVLGGSMAGLLAARVLSDTFDHVTLVERDALPEDFDQRKGVPQGRHVHALLVRGQRILESLFPGFAQELKSCGAVSDGTDLAGTGIRHMYGHAKLRFTSGLPMLLMSRPLIEGVVRKRVLALPNLTVLQNCAATELLTDATHTRVTGVRLDDRANQLMRDLSADLVIDATGRGSKAPQWLQALGYAAPAESVIKVDLAYATRIYRRDPHDLSHFVALEPPPHGSRGCALFAVEGDRFMLTLFGYAGDHPPTDDAGFVAFARSLPLPDVYERIKDQQPLSDVAVFKFPANLRRHYEKLARMPAGYLVIGDAVCSFNPIYGQGMSVSAMEAEALQKVLAASVTSQNMQGMRKLFYKEVAAALAVPWRLASGADLAYTKVEGKRNPLLKVVNAYLRQVHLATCVDEQVGMTFVEVSSLLKKPSAFFRPAFVVRVLRAARQLKQSRSVVDARLPNVSTKPATS